MLWGEELSLNEKILKNLEKFSEKHSNYLDKCRNTLIKNVEEEILYQALIGKIEFEIAFPKYVNQLPALKLGPENRRYEYDLSESDRKNLLQEVLGHFMEAENLPNLKLNINKKSYGRGPTLKFEIVRNVEEEIVTEEETL